MRGARIEKVSLQPGNPQALPEALWSIAEADAIVLGPGGSLFTSVIPNLLVEEIADAIRKSRAPPRIYVCNVMTQPGETDCFTAADHVKAIMDHAGREIVDYALINSGGAFL